MTEQLATTQATGREGQRHSRRGAERRRAQGAGRRPRLIDANRVLATVLYQRKFCTQAVLGELFAVDRGTIITTVQETRPLLEQHRHTSPLSTARFPTSADLIDFFTNTTETGSEIKPAC